MVVGHEILFLYKSVGLQSAPVIQTIYSISDSNAIRILCEKSLHTISVIDNKFCEQFLLDYSQNVRIAKVLYKKIVRICG